MHSTLHPGTSKSCTMPDNAHVLFMQSLSMWLWALLKIDTDVLLCCDVVAGEPRCIVLSDLEKFATAVLTKISSIVLEV